MSKKKKNNFDFEELADGTIIFGNWTEEERIEERKRAKKRLDESVRAYTSYIDRKIIQSLKL